LNIVIHNI